MQKRSIVLCIVFSIITCGIYTLYWMVKVNDDLNTLAKRDGTSGGMVILFSIITCGIYGWYWLYQMGKAVETIHMKYNEACGSAQILYLVLGLFGLSIVSMALMQDEVNNHIA